MLALVVSSGAVWWLVNRDESMPAVEATGQLRNTYPAAPTATWVVDAGQIFSRAQFAAPIPSPTGSNTPGFIDLGDTLVTTAYLPQSDRDADLVAIDSDSGTVRWTTELGFNVSCASRTVDGLLPCFHTQGFVEDHVEEVVFLKMSDGSVDHRIAASGIERIEVVGDDVVTAGYHGIARGSTTDLTEHWSTPWESRDSCPGSGDAQYFGADDEFVHFGTDAGSLVVRASDGKRVIDSDAQQVTVYPGHGLVAEVCRGGDPDNRLAVVLDSDGALLRSHASEGGFTSPLALEENSERYVVDGTAYDFGTGTQAWSYGSAVTDIVDDTALVLTGGPLTGVDLETGEIRWTHDFDPVESYTVPFMWMTDGERVLFEVDDDLRSVNLTDGALGVDDTDRRRHATPRRGRIRRRVRRRDRVLRADRWLRGYDARATDRDRIHTTCHQVRQGPRDDPGAVPHRHCGFGGAHGTAGALPGWGYRVDGCTAGVDLRERTTHRRWCFRCFLCADLSAADRCDRGQTDGGARVLLSPSEASGACRIRSERGPHAMRRRRTAVARRWSSVSTPAPVADRAKGEFAR